jgi:hypothetical protein
MAKKSRQTWNLVFKNPEIISHYLDHPDEFVVDIVFGPNAKENGGKLFLSDQQIQVLKSLGNSKRVSIRSGRGCGKSSTLVFIIFWFLTTRPMSKVIVTAPTAKQLYITLWPEIERWYKQCPILKELFILTNKKLYAWESPQSWYALSTTTDTPEGIQGAHADHLLLLLDEASGIPDDIFNTLSGSLTQDDNIIVAAGNPTQTSGFFFDSHNNARDSWKTFHFSSEDSPFVTRDFINDFESRYGRDGDMFKIHVLGEFPSASPDSFISLDMALKATMRNVGDNGEIQIGVDVAHFGDDLTAICVRKGNQIFPVDTYSHNTIPETVARVLAKVKELRMKYGYSEAIKVCIDQGGVGAGCSDMLAMDRENNIEVIPINFGSSGDDLHEYYVSVLWDNFKSKLPYLQLPDDDKLISELCNRKYKITQTGKVRIEPKSEYKKRCDKSPDRADSVILSVAKAENPTKILKSFDHLNTQMVKELSNMSYIHDSLRYCSVFQSKDRMFHVLFTNWSGNKLYITNEFETDDNVSYIARRIQGIDRLEKIIGNDRMFGTHGEDVSSQFRKFNISIYENYRYDEAGAMECLNLLLNQNRLVINSACSKAITQMRTWSYSKAKSSDETSFGMCYSLLNIVSELKDKIIRPETIKIFKEYTKEKDDAIKKLNKNRPFTNKSWQLW